MTVQQYYTRHRQYTTEHSGVATRSLHHTTYSGTISEPWKITSQADYPGTIYSPLYEGMDDVQTPNYWKRWAHGEIINNPMQYSSSIRMVNTGSFYVSRINRLGTSPNYYYQGYRESGSNFVGSDIGSMSWTYPAQPSISQSIISEALTEAWASVSLNEAQILVQVAEAGKTISGLFSIARRALKIFREVKRLDLLGLTEEFSPRELKNRYLELRYALRPIVYDMVGTLKCIDGILSKPKSRQTFRSYKSVVANTSSSGTLFEYPGEYRITGNFNATRTLECRAGVLTAIETIVSPILLIGATEPFQAIWELIPYSFIVDWFFNIGKLIASWSPKVGFRTLASWYVVTDTTTMTSTAVTGTSLASGYNYENIYTLSGQTSKVWVSKYRLPDPSRPVLPVFDLNLNIWKTFDLGAILTQFEAVSKLRGGIRL